MIVSLSSLRDCAGWRGNLPSIQSLLIKEVCSVLCVYLNQWDGGGPFFLSFSFIFSPLLLLTPLCLHANRLINIFRGVKSDPSSLFSCSIYTIVVHKHRPIVATDSFVVGKYYAGWRKKSPLFVVFFII